MEVSVVAYARPAPLLVTEEVDFIENRLQGVDAGFKDVKPYYEPLNDRFVHNPAATIDLRDTEDLRDAKSKFLRTLSEWNEKSREKDGKDSGVYLRNNEVHSWEDVILALESASKRYAAPESTGFRGKVRNYLRKCRDLKGPVESWIRLLPAESWQGSLLCGGLKVIVGVAVELDDAREEINDMIEYVPIAIQTAFQLKMIYKTNQLDKYSGRLMLATMECMQQALEYFMRHPAKKFVSALFRGKDYGRHLTDAVKDFHMLRELMAEVAMNELHASIKNNADKDDIARAQSFQMSNQVLKRVGELALQVEEGTELLNLMKSFFQDPAKRHKEDKRLKIERDRRRAEKEAMRRENEQMTAMWKDRVLIELEWDAEIAITDLAYCLRIGRSMSLDVESRIAYILNSKEVGAWLENDSDQRLVVNVRESQAKGTRSAASLFSSSLLSSLNERASGVSLYWFCGQQRREDPGTMVINLLGQLLDQGLKNVNATKLPNLRQIHDIGDIAEDFEQALALFLECLAIQLRETTVYCVLDCLSLYEDRRRVDDLVQFVTDLGETTGRFPLKILATSPMQCTHLTASPDLPEFSVLWVPRSVPRNRISI